MYSTEKKRRITSCFLLVSIVLNLSGCSFFGKGNVMEDIYRASIKEGGYSEFKKVKELEIVDYDSVSGQTEFGSGFYIPYKKEYLREEYEINLFIPNDRHGTEIKSVIHLTDLLQINIFMDYDHGSRTLILEPIEIFEDSENEDELGTHHTDEISIRKFLDECGVTEQDIKEYQNYILYDVVMQTWVRRNYYERELTERDYEDLQIEDHTFDFLS